MSKAQTSSRGSKGAAPEIRRRSSYTALLAEIRSLPLDDNYDDYKPPNAESLRRGEEFLSQVIEQMRSGFPVADPVPDGDGGLRLYWIRPGKNLQIDIPPSEEQPKQDDPLTSENATSFG